LWRKGVDVTLRSYSRYHIDMDILEEEGKAWRFTGVYGEPHAEHKERTWQTLRSLISVPAVPWLMAGDFNEVLFSLEKEGGTQKANAVWMLFGRSLRRVAYRIWGLRGIALHGAITNIQRRVL